MKTIVWMAILLSIFALPPKAVADEPDRQARPDSGDGIKSTAPIQQVAQADTSTLTGSGMNATLGPIDRPASGGAWRKDPGSRVWYFVRALSDAEMKLQHGRYLDELVRKHGNESRDIVIELKDTTDVAKLRALRIQSWDAPPCTIAVMVLYKQLPEISKAGLLFWGKGDPRPGPSGDKRLTLPPRPPAPPIDPRPAGDKHVPASLPSSPDGSFSTQAVAFSDGFEGYAVPGTNWGAGDYNPTSGLDYWGDLSAAYAYVNSGGSWSVSCSAHGDRPFFSYDNDQDSWMQQNANINMSSYSFYTVSYWLRLDSQSGLDYFRSYYNAGGGWIQAYAQSGSTAGWVQRSHTFPNTGHLYDNIAWAFKFESDFTGIVGSGAYVDDMLIDGTLGQANLTSYAPVGWSGPIVPSSVTGTTTTGTLYAGVPTYVDWAIQNNGSANTANTFYIDYYLDGAYIGGDTKVGLNTGTTYTRTDWSYTVPSSGNHTLKMVIDPTGAVGESNEGDNVYQQTFFWNPPPPPDLVVQSVVPTVTNPTVGQTIGATVTIRNQGAGPASGTFYTYFYKNLAASPTQGQLPYDDIHATFPLASGQTESYTITGLTSQFAVPWTMFAFVDATNAITDESNEGNNVSGGVGVNWNAGTATIAGALAYNDTSFAPGTGPQHPMRCVPVTLFDSDGGTAGNNWAGDDSLVVTVTDANGNFSFPPITNRDTDTDQGRLDLYVRVQVKNDVICVGNPVVAVRDGALKFREWRSNPMTDVTNGTPTIGTLKPADYATRSALHLYDTIFKGYDWALARGLAPPDAAAWYCELVWEPGYVPPHSITEYSGRKIYVVGEPTVNFLTPDEWDGGVVLHEYGHFLADLFHFEPTIPGRPPDGCPHDPTLPAECPPGTPSVQFAWSEGWPHYFACMTQASPPVPTRRNTGARKSGNSWTGVRWYEMNIETGGNSQDNDIPLASANDGMDYEVANAGVLWDIYDSVFDNQNGDACADNMADSIAHAWDVTANHPSNPNWNLGFFYRLYWERYTQGNPTLDQQLTEVYCEHGIPASGGNTVSAPGLSNLRLALGVAPNPARGPTVLTYAIPADFGNAPIEIGVFDVAGRLVRHLQRGPVGPGAHQIAWNGEDEGGRPTRAGMYFCRLTVADQERLLGFVVLR